jgi:hypothetical protein
MCVGIYQWWKDDPWLNVVGRAARTKIGDQSVFDGDAAVFARLLAGVNKPANTQPVAAVGRCERSAVMAEERHF